MSSFDIPQFGVMEGEDPGKIRAANFELQKRQRESMLNQLESMAVSEKNLSPEFLMEKFDKVLKRIDGDLREIEGMGPLHPDRKGSIGRTQKEIDANLKYFQDAGERLKTADGTFSKNLNKLRAFKDYLFGL
jgi:hypothetical protein